EHPDRAIDMATANLFIEGVQQLLPGGRPRKRGPLEQRAAETALVTKAFCGPVEWHAKPVHQVDDTRAPIGHFLYRWLMLQEVAAVHRVVQVQVFAVPLLARGAVYAIDSTLRTGAM